MSLRVACGFCFEDIGPWLRVLRDPMRRVADQEIQEASAAARRVAPPFQEQGRPETGVDGSGKVLERAAHVRRNGRVLRLGPVEEVRKWVLPISPRVREEVEIAPGFEVGARIAERGGAVQQVLLGRTIAPTADVRVSAPVPARRDQAGLDEAPRLPTQDAATPAPFGMQQVDPVLGVPDQAEQQPAERMAAQRSERNPGSMFLPRPLVSDVGFIHRLSITLPPARRPSVAPSLAWQRTDEPQVVKRRKTACGPGS